VEIQDLTRAKRPEATQVLNAWQLKANKCEATQVLNAWQLKANKCEATQDLGNSKDLNSRQFKTSKSHCRAGGNSSPLCMATQGQQMRGNSSPQRMATQGQQMRGNSSPQHMATQGQMRGNSRPPRPDQPRQLQRLRMASLWSLT